MEIRYYYAKYSYLRRMFVDYNDHIYLKTLKPF